MPQLQQTDVAAYIWPSYTGDEPRSRPFWPEGIGEWQTVRAARPRFPGHQWPRKPLWGYCNEADPYVMSMQIDAAADHGVNVFLYDWYWFDRRPFLEQCLNNGFLKAHNNSRMRFYLMWANHDATVCWDRRLAHQSGEVVWLGAVDRAEFERIAHRLIDRYFTHPLYYKLDGKPVFMIYDIGNLIRGLGGIDAVRSAFNWFRKEAVRAGLPGLHLQLTYWSEWALKQPAADGEKTLTGPEVVNGCGFDSMSHYQFVHATDVNRDYLEILADMEKEWERLHDSYAPTYFPHVSVGWDATPRYKRMEKPAIVKSNTPENVRKAFEAAKAYLDRHPEVPRLVTVNAWNEWTETSYLEPDDLNGYGYLEAIRSVFGTPT